MTKDAYYDMCDQLRSDPVEEEIPLDVADFPLEVVQAWQCYSRLPSSIDSFSGTYLGKDLRMVESVFRLLGIPQEDHLMYYDLIIMIDNTEKTQVQLRHEQRSKSKSAK